jgi:predicted amidophosphoribosyltransferase
MELLIVLLALLFFLLLFGYAIVDEVRKHRRTRGGPICPRCGYSLTGNVSGVCPECGTPVAR